jgi:hypothetical protein
MAGKTFANKAKTFSAYRMRRRRTALLLSLPQALPLPFGEFFDQRLDLLVVLHCLADALFPSLGDANLPKLSLPALD